MAKYRFRELKPQCPQWHDKQKPDPAPLPPDVNGPVEKVAQRIGDGKLLEQLERIRARKLYGTVVQYDGDRRPIAEFDFQHGMCPRLKLVEYDGRTVFARSIHNDNIDMGGRRPPRKDGE